MHACVCLVMFLCALYVCFADPLPRPSRSDSLPLLPEWRGHQSEARGIEEEEEEERCWLSTREEELACCPEREREQKKNKTEQEKKGAEGASGKEAGERDTARKKQWRGQKEQKSTAKGTER